MALSTKLQVTVKTKTKIVVLVHYPSIKKENQSPISGISEEKIKLNSFLGVSIKVSRFGQLQAIFVFHL